MYHETTQGNKFMNKPITNIKFDGEKATFDFCGGDPTGLETLRLTAAYRDTAALVAPRV